MYQSNVILLLVAETKNVGHKLLTRDVEPQNIQNKKTLMYPIFLPFPWLSKPIPHVHFFVGFFRNFPIGGSRKLVHKMPQAQDWVELTRVESTPGDSSVSPATVQ